MNRYLLKISYQKAAMIKEHQQRREEEQKYQKKKVKLDSNGRRSSNRLMASLKSCMKEKDKRVELFRHGPHF